MNYFSTIKLEINNVFEGRSTHLARTFMVAELAAVLQACGDKPLSRGHYAQLIEVKNCLGKRSSKSRTITKRHLAALYGLDGSLAEFRALLYFWWRDEGAQALLALLCAFARDPLLRFSAPFVVGLPIGSKISRETTEQFITKKKPDHFSDATLRSLAQNLNGTWTQSGHLSGKVNKTRIKVAASTGAVAYALFLGHVAGYRGAMLLQSPFTSLLDASRQRLRELAETASRRGWISFNRIDDVIEVRFPPELEPTAQPISSHEPA